MTDDDDAPDLGTCCICGVSSDVLNVVMLNRRGAVRGHGWGCLECGLPCNGAIAVLCDKCLPDWLADTSKLKFVGRGGPAAGERIAIDELPPGDFDHLYEHT